MSLSRWLEQLDRVPIGVLDLDLFATGPRLHLVAETNAGVLEPRDAGRKIRHAKHHAVPTARLLPTTVREGARARCAGPTQENLERSERDAGERRRLLVLEREAEMFGVERDRPQHVADLIADTVKARHDARLCVCQDVTDDTLCALEGGPVCATDSHSQCCCWPA